MALSVRREGYYAWLLRPTREERDSKLVSALKEVRERHPAYGVQSMIDELPQTQRPSYGKCYRICRDNGLLWRRRKPRGITKADPEAQAADDLINRDFRAEMPNRKWLTDITQMKCKDGKLYLCPVMDCYDAAIVGYSIDTNMKSQLCTAALTNAVNLYGKTAIIHSDRGSQFTSHLFRETVSNREISQSMGRTGSCYDNARIESFIATLKKELLYRQPLSTMSRDEVRALIFEWISYYNLRRRHTSNEGNMPPLGKRKLFHRNQEVA